MKAISGYVFSVYLNSPGILLYVLSNSRLVLRTLEVPPGNLDL